MKYCEIVDCVCGSRIDKTGFVEICDENCCCFDTNTGKELSQGYILENDLLDDRITEYGNGLIGITGYLQLTKEDVFNYVSGMVDYLNGKFVDIEFFDELRKTKLRLFSKMDLLHWQLRCMDDKGLEWVSEMDFNECEKEICSRWTKVDMLDNLIYKKVLDIAEMFNFEVSIEAGIVILTSEGVN